VIAVVDYKAGNLTSVMKALQALGADPQLTSDPAAVSRADKIILPGVGHFAATHFLETSGLKAAIRERIAAGVPFLGICVGLQWLFAGSTEAPGRKVPHVGWNSIAVRTDSRLFSGISNNSYVYFTHSYRAPIANATTAVTDYGGPFTAGIEHDNIMGVQFHPEKSGEAGLQILRNFLEWKPC
jgi:glutamine amidotransferase